MEIMASKFIFFNIHFPSPLVAATSNSSIRCTAHGEKKQQQQQRRRYRGGVGITAKDDDDVGKEQRGGGKGRGVSFGAVEMWGCASGCGACCKLDKGPSFPSPEEIFDQSHHAADLQLFKSMVGPDGWCIHYHHPTRTCSIYSERPSFCRVEPQVFYKLYGIQERRFNKEACSSCRDTIKAIYGCASDELKNFNRLVRSGGGNGS